MEFIKVYCFWHNINKNIDLGFASVMRNLLLSLKGTLKHFSILTAF